jgi:hypothetical protein
MSTQSSIYGRALAEAKTELESLRVDWERIARRKSQLEAFIANTEPLVPVNEPSLEFPKQESPAFLIPTKPISIPIWKSITQSINGKSESFSVKDALEGLARINRPIESPNRAQIVRNVLMKKTQNFEQIAAGLFKVKSGSKEKEASSEEKAS